MRKVFFAAIIAFSLFATGTATAQISHGGEPLFNYGNSKVAVKTMEMPFVDNEQYLQEDLANVKAASPMRMGVMQKCSIDVVEEARIVKDANGTHYLLAVESEGATFMSLHFSDFKIADGADLFFYDRTGEVVLGSFNGSDVLEDGRFYTQSIPGDVLYVEYNVPAGAEAGRLVIEAVCHGYKDIFASFDNMYSDAEWAMKGQLGNSEGNCHIDVQCSEGDDWRDQIRSVVAIELNDGMYSYMCSGAVINNVRQDRTPYVLSAYHCQELDNGLHGMTTYFRYQCRTCGGSTGFPINKSITGFTIKAKYTYNGGSDFMLYQLPSAIPDNYEPYYAGWDRTVAPSTTVGSAIHHPGGDWKKISIPKKIELGTGNAYKRFLVVSWYTGSQNKGVTEQGSSGSPLFNADKRIVGQLYAGSSACDNMGGTDLYGRVYYSWSGNNNDDGRLSTWLDPDNTGVSYIDGLDYKDNVGIAEAEQASATLKVYPNPSNGMVWFDIDAIGSANYKVFDLSGRCVMEGSTVLTSTSQAVNLTSLPAGSYLLQLSAGTRSYSTTVVIK